METLHERLHAPTTAAVYARRGFMSYCPLLLV